MMEKSIKLLMKGAYDFAFETEKKEDECKNCLRTMCTFFQDKYAIQLPVLKLLYPAIPC